jgi:phosphoserine phosphatase RsbU/P
MDFHKYLPKDKEPYIFIVDDLQENLQVLGYTLMEEGFDVSMASSGKEALEIIADDTPDLILLDVMMPGMNGFEVCEKLKEMESTRDIPVIFLTAKTETEDIVEGFKVGGVDYITKPFQKEELLARICTHLTLKYSQEALAAKNKALEVAKKQIDDDIARAADHILSILPKKFDNKSLKIEWKFKPSRFLSGDTFGYHFVDENNIAIYLVDVCGHGVGPALHSVSVINTIRNHTLPETDFAQPEKVLTALNNAFDMFDHNNLFFTIWYGVYNTKDRSLVFSSGGHPPALLYDKKNNIQELAEKCPMVGGVQNFEFQQSTVKLKKGSELYIYSDGAFEAKSPKGDLFTDSDMINFITEKRIQNKNEINLLYKHLVDYSGKDELADDFTMIKVHFK